MKQQWKVEVGLGYATPLVVGDRLYLFTRQGEEEVMTAVDVMSGKVILDDSVIADGTDVYVLTRDADEAPKLSPEELAELEAGLAEADRGDMISGEAFFKHLRRHG